MKIESIKYKKDVTIKFTKEDIIALNNAISVSDITISNELRTQIYIAMELCQHGYMDETSMDVVNYIFICKEGQNEN